MGEKSNKWPYFDGFSTFVFTELSRLLITLLCPCCMYLNSSLTSENWIGRIPHGCSLICSLHYVLNNQQWTHKGCKSINKFPVHIVCNATHNSVHPTTYYFLPSSGPASPFLLSLVAAKLLGYRNIPNSFHFTPIFMCVCADLSMILM